MTEDATPSPRSTETRTLSQLMWFVGLGYLIYILADPRDGIAKLVIKYTLKDQFHMNAERIALFGLIVSIAWYLKPLAGIITDTISIRGSRRKNYILGCTFLAGLVYLGIALVNPGENLFLAALLFLNIALVFAQTTLGGVMVGFAQQFKSTGRMASVRNAAESTGVISASIISGLLAGGVAGKGAFTAYAVSFGLFIALTVFTAFLFKEEKEESGGFGALKERLGGFKVLFKPKALWATSFFWFLVRFSPGFQTPLFVHQSDVLKFSPEFVGNLMAIQATGNLLASFFYVWACRRYPLKNLLLAGVLVNVLASACYLGYTSSTNAIPIEALYGIGNGLAFMPFLDLIARSTPKKFEALGYSLIFAFGNISLYGSDYIGSKIYEHLGRNFSGMVWMNTATSLLVIVGLPLLPKALIAGKEGMAHIGEIATVKETGELG